MHAGAVERNLAGIKNVSVEEVKRAGLWKN
jgi:hypothetical protein